MKLGHRVVSDNRKVWKTIGPFFSEKAFHKESIILNNNNKTVSNNEELVNLWKTLNIDETLATNRASSDIPILCLTLLKSTKIIQILKKNKHFMSGKDRLIQKIRF